MPILLGAFCLLAGASAAVADALDRGPESGVLKMLAATAYLAFAVSLGAFDTPYGRLVMLALSLSWLGDLFLIGTGRLFTAGLGAFLLAHVAYAAAFLVRGVTVLPVVVGAVVMLAVGVVVMRWLLKAELDPRLRAPVAAYVVAIGAMVALAAGAAWPRLMAGGVPAVVGRAILVGAVTFAVSDILVARNRFVKPEPMNRLAGLPLYFGAQLFLASTV